MQRFLRKAMSIFLAIAMMLAVIPGFSQPAKADPTGSWDESAATEFAGGTGESTDPYLIATEAQLAYLAKQVNTNTDLYSGKYFELTADLDLSAHEWVGIGSACYTVEEEWGSQTYYYTFQGNFDGNNHVITGLYINKPETDRQGLFSSIESGTISHLGLKNVSVAGKEAVGALIGYGEVSSVSNCYATGSVSGTINVGGLIGDSGGGAVSNCYTTGSVSGSSKVGGLIGNSHSALSYSWSNASVNVTTEYAGGLCGTASSPVDHCYAAGNVIGANSNYMGGFIGSAEVNIQNCYATGNVSGGNRYIGGFLGLIINPRTVSYCYATGDVSGSDYVGGFIGKVTYYNRFIKNCLAAGSVTASGDSAFAGGFSGHLAYDDSNIINCYFKDNTYGGDDGIGTIDTGAGTPSCTNKPEASFYSDAATYTTAGNWDTAAWDLDSTWILNSGDSYPTLRNMPSEPDISEGQPAGTGADADNPYLITTAGNLLWMSQNCTAQSGFSGKYFKQTANIDLTDLGEFVPIGSASQPFKGHYDGNNHKISELYIHGSYSETGLFGDLKEGTIENLTLEDVSISGNNWAVAGFVGYLETTGTVANCHITKSNGGSSSIEGTYAGGGSAIGGIAGENDGTIEYCSNAADISNHRSYAVGGIAGGSYTSGSEGIYNCYNSGAITGTTGTGALGTVTGGIVGDLSGNISHCYNIGTVTVGQLNSIGGIVGKIGSGSILGNYFLATAADSGIGIDTPGTNSLGATAKTSTQLKTKSTFDGWNFTTGPLCWVIDGSSNSGYPFISSPAVVLASGSLGTAGDSIIIGLTSGTVYKVTVDSTVYYVKADGTLSTSASDAAALTGTEITGLSNGTTYLVEVYSASVTLTAGSLGTAGDSKITGLAAGVKYQVITGSTVFYVKADGTLSASVADIGELAGTEVNGLVNGTTYKVELYSSVPSAPANLTATRGNGRVSLSWDPVTGAVGYSVYQSITSGSYGSALDSVSGTVYAVTGLTNGTPYYFKVKAYNAAGYSTFSNEATAIPVRGGGNSDESSSNSAAPSTPSGAPGANILVNGQSQNAGTVVTSQQGSRTVTTVVVDQQKLEQKLASEGNNAVVTIPVNSQSDITIGELNGQMVKNMETKAAVLELKTPDVTYTLPAQQINIEAISNQLGQNVGLKDIKVQIEISRPSAQEVQVVESTAQKGEFSIVIPPVQFSVKCTYNNQTIEIASFNHYVERTIAIPDGVDPNKITTGVVFDLDGTVRHVPTQVVKIDGKYYAKINSLTNSTYSVIWNPIEFNDVADHWARTAINDMGSRMVVSGVGSKTFEPDRGITRAEFATVMVKALGLKPGIGSNPFQDVKASEWYTDFIKNAYEYKIISGYSATAFGPADKITREQAMTMIYKAMKITNLKVELEAGELEKLLVKYSYSVQTAEWARESMAACVKAGIVSGKSANIIGPRDEISRAEVAVMVRQLLQKSVLI